MKYGDVTDEVEPQVFFPRRQSTTLGTATFYVRGTPPPQGLLNVVRETAARAAPTVPITDLQTMRQQVRENLAKERFFAGASTAFGVLVACCTASKPRIQQQPPSCWRASCSVRPTFRLGVRRGWIRWWRFDTSSPRRWRMGIKEDRLAGLELAVETADKRYQARFLPPDVIQ